MKEKKCCAGCNHYEGGESYHLKECDFYPESLTKINEDKITRLEGLLLEARNLLFEYKDDKMAHWQGFLQKTENIKKMSSK
jgi:hypothetical protein